MAQTTTKRQLTMRERIHRLDLNRKALLGIAIVFFSFFALFPFIWMFITSIRAGSELYQVGTNPFQIESVTLDHYRNLLEQTQFLKWMWNSFVVATVASVIALVIGVAAAYSLGRLRYKGGSFIALVVFATYLIPPVLLFIPLNDVVNRLRLSNTLWSLILGLSDFSRSLYRLDALWLL